MKRIQLRRMLMVVCRLMAVLILVTLPANGAQGQISQPGASSSTPAGWQTYTDPDFGWSIQYPNDWFLEETFVNPRNLDEFVIRRKLTLYAPGGGAVWIDSYDNRAGLSLVHWFENRRQPLLSSRPDQTVFERAILDGEPAVLAIDATDPSVTAQVVIAALHRDQAIAITYLMLDGGAEVDRFIEIARRFRWSSSPGIESARILTQIPTLDRSLLVAPAADDVFSYSSATCCGITSSRSICHCCFRRSLNNQPVGNCVWWACYKRPDVPCAGNADTWANCAKAANKTVNETPAVGALVTWNSSNHIAYVEEVSGDRKQVYISEMNCYSTRACGGNTGYNGVSYRWVSVSDKKFIHSDQPAQCTDNNNPDGNYDQPVNNQQVSDSVRLKGWARDDCGVDYVEFTATWPGQGWKVVKRVDTDCGRGDTCTYEYDWNLSGIPDGWITLGYDIYDKAGKKSLSPHGTRQIRKVGRCDGPGLREPTNGWQTKNRTITFKWNDVGCTHTGFRLRVKTVPDMDAGGQTLADVYVGGTEHTLSLDAGWENRPLYWSVRAENAPGGARWAGSREFRIVNDPPTISFNTANGSAAGAIHSRDRYWTFRGTASDPEGQLNRIEWRCDGDNCGNEVSRSGLADWTYVRDNLDGRNDIRFVAYDNQGNRSNESRHLDLNIDRAAPVTTLSLNNDANPANWPTWFTTAVDVRLRAEDGATGRARSGVKEVRYRLDGGGWQTAAGAEAAFTVAGDGSHTVEYYATDNVGNSEGGRTVAFRVDRTPPAAPSGIVETHGVPNGQWQRAQNVASFTWAAATDAASGLWGYQFYFGPDPAGVSNQSFLAGDPRQWTPQPGGVRTGTYYLRGRTRDNAGNWSGWADLFTFRYDGAPPENPAGATHALGATVVRNDVWQRTTSVADFTWPVPHDEGSGVKGYSVYWGADPNGTSGSFITANRYQSGAPLCGANAACTGYLRLRSRDHVDNEPVGWATVFVLRYDNAPPVADFTFSQGLTTTQTLVNLQIAATDQGSGVREMRLSGDGQDWTSWEVYTTTRPWTIPAISRQSWPVYLQVRDGVGLTSAVISHTIYLDVNPQQPRSTTYRLFDYAMSAGAGEHTSAPTGYKGRSTVGQVVDSAQVASQSYRITGGYQAGSQAIPIVEPGHDEFEFVNGIFASGTGATTLTSPTFRMIGTLGEIGVPNNETTLTSQRHRLQPGFLAAAPRASATPTPTPTPGPTPTPPPTPACDFPRISINNAAVFTNNPNVTLSICAPNAKEMKISNDGGFGDAQWEPYAASKAWALTTYGQYVLPRFVYAAFKDRDGTVHGVYFDDIILDPNPPDGALATDDGAALVDATAAFAEPAASDAAVITVGGVKYLQRLRGMSLARPLALLAPNADGAVALYVTASDDNSGVAAMQISAGGVFSDTAWEPYSALRPWTPEGGDGVKTVYARFRDAAGNVSAAAQTSFALDTMPPIGGIAFGQRVAGPDTMSLLVYLGAEDNLSGVSDMRVGRDPAFGDAPWRPYTTTLAWPISLAGAAAGDAITLYVQYRDEAGNVSETYSDSYIVDTIPPMVYIEVGAGETLTRPVNIFAYDELSDLAMLRLSNDPLLIEGVVTLPYTDTVTWTFDERRVVWVQVKDAVGNWSEPYPAYAAPTTQPERKVYLPLVLR